MRHFHLHAVRHFETVRRENIVFAVMPYSTPERRYIRYFRVPFYERNLFRAHFLRRVVKKLAECRRAVYLRSLIDRLDIICILFRRLPRSYLDVGGHRDILDAEL